MDEDNWGFKFNISIYMKGEQKATDVLEILSQLKDLELNERVDFVGISTEIVKEEPKEQIAT